MMNDLPRRTAGLVDPLSSNVLRRHGDHTKSECLEQLETNPWYDQHFQWSLMQHETACSEGYVQPKPRLWARNDACTARLSGQPGWAGGGNVGKLKMLSTGRNKACAMIVSRFAPWTNPKERGGGGGVR